MIIYSELIVISVSSCLITHSSVTTVIPEIRLMMKPSLSVKIVLEHYRILLFTHKYRVSAVDLENYITTGYN